MFDDGRLQNPSVLLAAGEAFPFAKTGGLGDVVGALPAALERIGCKSAVILPAYRDIYRCGRPITVTGLKFVISIGSKQVTGGLLESTLPNSSAPVYFVKQDEYFDRPGLYAEKNVAYQDNCERFVFFARAVLEAVRLLDLQ